MKIDLIFDDWRKDGQSIYHTEEGVELSLGDFHTGTTFDGEIELDITSEHELQDAIEAGYEPLFLMSTSRGREDTNERGDTSKREKQEREKVSKACQR